MGYKFTIEDNLERVVNYDMSGNELVIYDKFEGFNVVEDEDIDDGLAIWFKDISRDLSVVQRYFNIDKKELPFIKDYYNKYKNNPTGKYIKLLELKKQGHPGMEISKDVYFNNRCFFISSNITLNEWFQFCGLAE